MHASSSHVSLVVVVGVVSSADEEVALGLVVGAVA
jgi:hypothetical protein